MAPPTCCLLVRSGDLALAEQAGIWVGILCLLVAEVPAWLVARWRRSQTALREAREAAQAIAAQLGGSAPDAAALWQASAARLRALLDVPNCDIYRSSGADELVCIASVCDGQPYPEYLGRRAELSLWAVDREAIWTSQPVLIASPDDPRLSAAERAEMLDWNEQAVLLVALVVGEETIGVVELGETRAGRTITSEQIPRQPPSVGSSPSRSTTPRSRRVLPSAAAVSPPSAGETWQPATEAMSSPSCSRRPGQNRRPR